MLGIHHLSLYWVTTKFTGKPGVGRILNKLTGTVFIGLGIKLALSRAE